MYANIPCQSFEHENPAESLPVVEIKTEVMEFKDHLYQPLTLENPIEFVPVMSIKEELPDVKDEHIPVHYLEVSPAHIIDGCNADSDNIKLENCSEEDPLSITQKQSGYDNSVEASCNYKPSECTSLKVTKSQLYCNNITVINEDLNNSALYNDGKPANCVTEYGKKCDDCGKCFTHRSHLVCDSLVHSAERKHKCQDCGKCFTQRNHLVNHFLIHSGNRKYKCAVCGKCFPSRGLLVRHSLNHFSNRKYKCETCGKCYTLRAQFFRHSLIHASERK